MAAFKETKKTYLIEFTYDEIMFLKRLTQNQLYDFPVPFDQENPFEQKNRENIFFAIKDALENNNV